ncbi:MAG TPA: response regulator [Myxococcota bacterium]|nr:response regulator [Myxococcota bacterium]
MAASVLYVDDDRNLCQIVAKALAGEGYSVRTCHDGAEALAIISEHVPDLMLLDLKLPRRDGLQVLSELRKSDGDMRDLPVVVLTGAPTASSAQRVNELEAVDLLTKPVSLEKLLEVVSRCVAGAKSEVPARPPAQGAIKRRGSGNLERVAFPALLHHLHGLRATGTLHLETEKKRKWIELRDGYPVAVRSNLMRETLGKHLLRTGRVSPEVLEASRREAEKSGTRHGEILVAMHALSEEQVTEALREQADEKFFEIFSWPAGTFRFQRGARIERANALGLGRSPASLILHGVHTRFPIERVDGYFSSQAGRYLAHGESPFYRFQDLAVEPGDAAFLRAIDGSRQLGEFRGEEERRRRTIYGLIAAGMLELRMQAAAPAARVVSAHAATHPVREHMREHVAAHPGRDRRQDDPRQLELMALADQLRAQDAYEVLGVARGASAAEIQAAYERLAAQAHPDRFQDGSQALRALAEEVFGRVRAAFETLNDPREKTLQALASRKLERKEQERQKSERAFQAEVERRKGETALTGRSYEAALAHFGKALELYPDEGDHHAYYGYVLHLCHPGDAAMAAEAIEHVKRGIKLASHREKPYLFLGRLNKAVGRADEAEKMFVRAVHVEPKCLEAIRELRLIQMRREKSKGLIGRLFRR